MAFGQVIPRFVWDTRLASHWHRAAQRPSPWWYMARSSGRRVFQQIICHWSNNIECKWTHISPTFYRHENHACCMFHWIQKDQTNCILCSVFFPNLSNGSPHADEITVRSTGTCHLRIYTLSRLSKQVFWIVLFFITPPPPPPPPQKKKKKKKKKTFNNF